MGKPFDMMQTVLQVRLTTAQKLVVRHLKCHGLGPRIANRLVTLLYQQLRDGPSSTGGDYMAPPLYKPLAEEHKGYSRTRVDPVSRNFEFEPVS